MRQGKFVAVLIMVMVLPGFTQAAEPEAAARGEKALTTRAFNLPAWSARAYQNAWRQWDSKTDSPPAHYAEAFRQHYGLHPAPFANGPYPMGLRESHSLFL